MEYLPIKGNESVTVFDLSQAASVSERTLRTAINDYFGIGPIAYLQLRQPNRVHCALKAADPEEMTVSQVLIAHDEFAFSRFASRYRKLFGQSPSETLRSRAD